MIIDSGERREFSTGAVRDIQEGKGRCDLMPLKILKYCYETEISGMDYLVLWKIGEYQETGDIGYLAQALGIFLKVSDYDTYEDMFLDVAKHFEDGAKKYGEYNWQKGIPTHCYIDSATRHFLKYMRGDKDERHDRSFVWNIVCCMYTSANIPDMEDYKYDNNK